MHLDRLRLLQRADERARADDVEVGPLDPALPKIRPNSVMNTIGNASEKNSAVRSRTIIFMLAIVIA